MEKRACANMKGFDDLPPCIRQAVHGFPDVAETDDINEALKQCGYGRNGAQHDRHIEAQFLDLIADQERVWLHGVNRNHREKYGQDLPHVLAKATICRPTAVRLY